MMHPSDQATLTRGLNNAISSSKTWSDVAHKTFVEMAENARQDVIMKGDFSFVHAFRKQFGIGEPRAVNGMTPETQLNVIMQPIQEHFAKFGQEYERERKRASYMQMLRSGRKEEFLVILRSHLGTYNEDHVLTQEVWRVFNEEEKARQQREEEELRRVQLEKMKKEQQLSLRIEQEAKRRIEQEARQAEQEAFEAAVQAKMRELKQ